MNSTMIKHSMITKLVEREPPAPTSPPTLPPLAPMSASVHRESKFFCHVTVTEAAHESSPEIVTDFHVLIVNDGATVASARTWYPDGPAYTVSMRGYDMAIAAALEEGQRPFKGNDLPRLAWPARPV